MTKIKQETRNKLFLIHLQWPYLRIHLSTCTNNGITIPSLTSIRGKINSGRRGWTKTKDVEQFHRDQNLPGHFVFLKILLLFLLRQIHQLQLHGTAEQNDHGSRVVLIDPLLDFDQPVKSDLHHFQNTTEKQFTRAFISTLKIIM